MNEELLKQRQAVPLAPRMQEATVAVELDTQRFLLDDGRVAATALTCLIEPRVGDVVLVAERADGSRYIVHILARDAESDGASNDVVLTVPGATKLTIAQVSIDIVATERAALRSMKHADIVAATGTLNVTANDLFRTVTESVVDAFRHYVGHAEHYLLDVDQLLRQHGKQVMITAEKDVKVDADRISMG
ncbi:DUF3540 domain-containing protein [Caballeronia sp. SEWSISQ10-4 2]|uniref:DUF3540 domain-containing protein n=1 Tax=Caballeronia sp. SEWSISQ10-4 2 TaxID=2937438 RepID=UPI00264CFA4D|nr:DUF3540 domain-containing protein [Caballeronia sp. SEWSISQ10-4 2]MDN7183254.1 DUF3540 domain-containing protein [Caballeronia sp. SEWSISQ10-4 2]